MLHQIIFLGGCVVVCQVLRATARFFLPYRYTFRTAAGFFCLMGMLLLSCKKEELPPPPPPPPLPANPPLATDSIAGTYRVDAFRIIFDSLYSYPQVLPDTVLYIVKEDENSLGVQVYGEYFSVHYDAEDPDDPLNMYFLIENYSTTFASFLNVIEPTPDSIQFYYSYYTPPMSGIKYIFGGRRVK